MVDDRLRSAASASAGGVFICYRREDSGHAGRIYDHLSRHLPRRLFLDVSDITAGADFIEAIERAIASSSALLVIIGRDWLDATDEAGHRCLDQPNDFVRIEIASALRLGILVVPALLPGAAMPRARDLPPDIAALATRQAREIRDSEFSHDVARLARTLDDLLPDRRARMRRRAAAPALGILLVSSVVAWYAWTQAQPDAPTRVAEGDPAPGQDPSTVVASPGAEDVAGIWVAVAPYYTPDPGGEWAFEFQPAGDRLLGTSWGWDGTRPVLDGAVAGESVSFRTVWRDRPTYAGETTYRDWWTDYRARIFVDSLRFDMVRDDGLSYRFTAYRRDAVPRHDAFTVSTDTIVRGESVELCWDLRWTESARIDPLVGEIDPSGTGCARAAPAQPTDFRLTLTGATGMTRTVAVPLVVLPPMSASSRPVPISPADGDSVDSRTSIVWHALAGATRYVVELTTCDSSECDTTQVELQLAFDTTYSFQFYPSTDSARWRVQGVDRAGRRTRWSDFRRMIVR